MDEQTTGLDLDFQNWITDLTEPARSEPLGSFASLASLCTDSAQTTGWISTIIKF